jgi:hypothetical protein
VDAEDEHSPSALRHSEVASVENPVGPPIPEFPQRTEERPKISAGIRGEEARNVLEEDGGRSVALHKSKEREGEAGPLAGEAAALPGDGEILTGEASGPEVGFPPTRTVGAHGIDASPVPTLSGGESVGCGAWSRLVVGSKLHVSDIDDASEVGDTWPSLGEDGAGVGVDLGEGDGAPSGALEPQIDSSGPGEEAGVREFIHRPHRRVAHTARTRTTTSPADPSP